MIQGFHFIFSAYGFWLPNDPRGSWSDTVREFNLRQFGPATKVATTRSVAGKPHNHQQRLAAKQALRYPLVRFTGEQAVEIAKGFSDAMVEQNYVVNSLAILPDHVHLVMAYHSRDVDKIAAHMKAKATSRLSRENLQPLKCFPSPQGRVPSPWARNHWCPFIRSTEYMQAAIRYVEENPVKAGLRRQNWSLVTPYNG